MSKKPAIPLSRFSNPKNYGIALSVSRRALAAKDPGEMAINSGCPFDEETSSFEVLCLDHPFTVTYPDGLVKYKGTDLEPYFVLQIIMINYLARADGAPLNYQYIPYRDLEGGNAYYGAFQKTAIKPLAKAFGSSPEKLPEAAAPFGGIPHTQGSGTGVILYLFPRVPLLFKIWPGDDEFPPQANVLFDSSANHYLHTEDLAAVDVVTRILTKNPQRKDN
ncbi:DUF3786 domain-containing protein [Dethiobacter alkaliphilus]|uniref:DUF3786 domain-containing protein n=1 Tax=Dethiobacter alkaliphilus AHT 1 TaxID=555088 RepID=C0GKF6_DETAL|nr:DUF3786 domain-containing protein [Dethiobacter alkaliphilus]EEG76199.1 conserved hypothetical protein [Dethiobacter alkaliphilus AHT 1]